MDQEKKNEYLNFAMEFVTSDKVRSLCFQISKRGLSKQKADGVDLATKADLAIEKLFREEVHKKYPMHGVQGEEMEKVYGDYLWLIDPIDGTKAFAVDVPLWTITIALTYFGETIVGVIYNPMCDQLHYATKSGGAFMNGKPLRYNLKPIKKSQLVFDYIPIVTPDSDVVSKNENQKIKESTLQLLDNFYRVRTFGSGTLSLAWMASGLFGGYISLLRPKEKFVDLAAGLLIAEESGAHVSVIDLSKDYQYIVAGSDEIHRYLWEVYTPIFNLQT